MPSTDTTPGPRQRVKTLFANRQPASPGELIEWCRDRVGSTKKPNSVESSDEPYPSAPYEKWSDEQ